MPKSTNQTQIFATYCKTPAALTISTKHIKFPRLYSFSCCYLFDVFSKCACSPHAVKNSIISKKHQQCECASNQWKTYEFAWFWCSLRYMCVVIVSLVLEFVLSLLHREVLRTSSCFRFVLASRRLEFDKKSKILNQPLDTSIVLFF